MIAVPALLVSLAATISALVARVNYAVIGVALLERSLSSLYIASAVVAPWTTLTASTRICHSGLCHGYVVRYTAVMSLK